MVGHGRWFATALLLLSTLSLNRARADMILYYTDFVLGDDRMAAALANRAAGGDTVVVATSDAEFETLLNGGGFQLGIFLVQNFAPSDYSGASR